LDSSPPPTVPPADIPIPTDHIPAVTPVFEGWLGFHDQLIRSESFDPFSEDDQLPTFHAALAHALSDFEAGQLALVVNADLGGTEASLRGQATDLGVMRFGLGPELRFPVLGPLYAFGRLSPQGVRISTELVESSSGAHLAKDQWALGLDAAIGASARIAALNAGLERPLGVFFRVEAGYFWTQSVELGLTPTSGGPVRTAPLDLGELALHGVSFGAGLGIGY
jgi:hypothetical protein